MCVCARNQNGEGGFVRLWLVASITMRIADRPSITTDCPFLTGSSQAACAPAVCKTYCEYTMPIIGPERVKILTGVYRVMQLILFMHFLL